MKKDIKLLFALFSFLAASLFAGSIDQQTARRAALAWFNTCPAFTRSNTNYTPSSEMKEILNSGGTRTIAYVLTLEPEGFIITSSDNEINPVIAYSESSHFNGSDVEENTLLFLLRNDLPERLDALEKGELHPDYRSKAKSLWSQLSEMVHAEGKLLNKSSLLLAYDVEHGPFLTSEWGQSTDGGGNAAFNYYTPNSGYLLGRLVECG